MLKTTVPYSRSPDTILNKETRLYFLQCMTCHSSCSVQAIKTGFQVRILDCDWSILVTWPEYWPVIGQYWSRDLNTELWLADCHWPGLFSQTECEPGRPMVSVQWPSVVCENPENTICLWAVWAEVLKPQSACFVIQALELSLDWVLASDWSRQITWPQYGLLSRVITGLINEILSRWSPGPRNCMRLHQWKLWKEGPVLAESFTVKFWLCPMHLEFRLTNVLLSACTLYLMLDKREQLIFLILHSFS